MKTFAFVLASACALIAPPVVSAEGRCPGRNWELIFVDAAFPADVNDNGLACVKYHHRNPDEAADNWVYFRDDF